MGRCLRTVSSVGEEAGSLKMLPPSHIAVSSKSKAQAVDTSSWTTLERQLLVASRGRYDPRVMAVHRRLPHGLGASVGTGCRVEAPGRVSVVSPTMASRQRYHEALWACFEAQDVPDKELIVLETYETTPSPFLVKKAAEDPRLVHVCIKVVPGADFSVGLKRNMTLHLASGEFIVNFDDDDLYAPCYASTMVGEMRSKSLQGVTLSAWYNFYTTTGLCTYSDPSSWDEWASSEQELEAILYGYGFSYAHRRHASLEAPYPDVRFAEDAPFFLGLRRRYGENKVGLLRDEQGICMHIMHRANSAQVLGSCEVDDDELDSLAIVGLAPFQQYREAAPDDDADEDEGLFGTLFDAVTAALAHLMSVRGQEHAMPEEEVFEKVVMQL